MDGGVSTLPMRIPAAADVYGPEDRSVHVVACPDPFSAQRVSQWFAPGLTIGEIMREIQPKASLRAAAHVWIGDEFIPRENWNRVRPKPHTRLTIRCVPMGGGNTKILRMVLMLAVAAAAIAAPFTFGASWVAGNVALAGLISIGVSTIGPVMGRVLISKSSKFQ